MDFLKRLYYWLWGTASIYPVPAKSKESIDQFERYCIVLPVFGFNSAKFDINLIKSYLLQILVDERDIEPTATKRLINLFSWNSVTFSYLTLWSFSVLTQVLTIFSKLTSLTIQKCFSTKNGSIIKSNWTTKNFHVWLLPPKSNPIEEEYIELDNLLKSGLSRDQEVAKLRMNNSPPTGAESYV